MRERVIGDTRGQRVTCYDSGCRGQGYYPDYIMLHIVIYTHIHPRYMGIGQIRRHIGDANLAGNI